MKNEKWDDAHGNTTPDDRMVAFLESPTDPQHGSLSAEDGSGWLLHQTGFAGCESPGFAPANLLQQPEPVRKASERNR